MRSKVKIVLVIIAALLVAGFAAYSYIMKGGARNVQDEKPLYTLVPEKVIGEFATNEAAASKKYIDKPVVLTGVVTTAVRGEVVIGSKVICTMKDSVAVQPGATITLKGRVVGFDSLMEELKLDQCTITNQ